MPSEGVELSPNATILTDDEVVRLATLFVKNGVTKIRLTGGEPTVRKGLVQIVGSFITKIYLRRLLKWFFAARLNELREHGLKSIGMTTNGIVLHRRLPELVQNGLTHLNIRYIGSCAAAVGGYAIMKEALSNLIGGHICHGVRRALDASSACSR